MLLDEKNQMLSDWPVLVTKQVLLQLVFQWTVVPFRFELSKIVHNCGHCNFVPCSFPTKRTIGAYTILKALFLFVPQQVLFPLGMDLKYTNLFHQEWYNLDLTVRTYTLRKYVIRAIGTAPKLWLHLLSLEPWCWFNTKKWWEMVKLYLFNLFV